MNFGNFDGNFQIKHNQTIHVEIDVPLLEPNHQTNENNEENSKIGLNLMKSLTTQSLNIDKLVQSKSPSPYNRPNEPYNEFCFKTIRKQWNKNIEFPTVDIPVAPEMLTELRDTFKSTVTVRVVYLKVIHLTLIRFILICI